MVNRQKSPPFFLLILFISIPEHSSGSSKLRQTLLLSVQLCLSVYQAVEPVFAFGWGTVSLVLAIYPNFGGVRNLSPEFFFGVGIDGFGLLLLT